MKHELLNTYRRCVASFMPSSKRDAILLSLMKSNMRQPRQGDKPEGSSSEYAEARPILRYLARNEALIEQHLAEQVNYDTVQNRQPPLSYWLARSFERQFRSYSMLAPRSGYDMTAIRLFNVIVMYITSRHKAPPSREHHIGRDTSTTVLSPAAHEYLRSLGLCFLNDAGLIPIAQMVTLADGRIVNKRHAEHTQKWGWVHRTSLRKVTTAYKGKDAHYINGVPHILFSDAAKYGLYLDSKGDLRPVSEKYTTPIDNTYIGKHGSSSRSGKVRFIGKRERGVRIGFEWEHEVHADKRASAAGKSLANAINKLVGEPYIAVEEDSSLRRGFELVSSNTASTYHKKMLAIVDAKFKAAKSDRGNPLSRVREAAYSVGCHIHIDRRDIKNLKAFVYFINKEASNADRVARRDGGHTVYSQLFQRVPNRWCSGVDYSNPHEVPNKTYERTVACNTKPEKTVEVRAFLSPSTALGMIENINVVEAIVDWTNQMVTLQPERLCMDRFVEYVRKHADKYQHVINRLEGGATI